MKKLLSIAAISALLVTGANADNVLTVTGTVDPAATVHLGTAPSALTTGTGIFEDSTISFANSLNLGAINTESIDLFLATNTTGAVTMTITPAPIVSGTGSMATSFSYTPTGGSVDTDNIYDLGGTTNDGSTKVGVLSVSVTPSAAQLAGAYTNNAIAVGVTAAL